MMLQGLANQVGLLADASGGPKILNLGLFLPRLRAHGPFPHFRLVGVMRSEHDLDRLRRHRPGSEVAAGRKLSVTVTGPEPAASRSSSGGGGTNENESHPIDVDATRIRNTAPTGIPRVRPARRPRRIRHSLSKNGTNAA